MHLSKNFTLAELTHSQEAVRKGLDNTPDPDTLENLKVLASGLESVREALGSIPIVVSSGYRSPKVNAAVGGSRGSQHLSGLAADFTAPKFGTPKEICLEIIAAGVKFDQLICEGVSEKCPEGAWVHVSFGEPARGQVLTAKFTNGKATYTQGLA